MPLSRRTFSRFSRCSTSKPGEGAAAGAALLHRGLVALAPRVGEGARVQVRAAVAGEEGGGVAGDALAPVHDGAEHVEDEGLDRVHHRGPRSAHRFSKSQTSGKPISSQTRPKP
jgi:hypothetical protein